MAGKLYKQQDATVSFQPQAAKITNATMKPLTDAISENTARIAKENYELGNSIAIQDSIRYAYEKAPASPKQFNELADKAIKTYTERLPSRQKDNMMGKFALLKMKYMAHVKDNFDKKQDAEHKRLVGDALNSNNQEYMSSLIIQYQGNANNNKDLEALGIQGRLAAQENINKLANKKDINGNYIFSDKDKAVMMAGQSGHLEALKTALYGLSDKAIKDWDTNVFQNRDKFMKDMGVSADTYDKMSKWVGERIKDLDNKYERKIKAQTAFDTVNYVRAGDTESLKKMADDGLIPKDFAKSLNEAIESPTSEYAGENARSLESNLLYLQKVTNNFDLNIIDDPEKIFGALTNLGQTFNQYVKNSNLDENQKREFLDTFSRWLGDKAFAQRVKRAVDDGIIIQTPMLPVKEKYYPEENTRVIKSKYKFHKERFGDKEADDKLKNAVSQDVAKEWWLAALDANENGGDYKYADEIYMGSLDKVVQAQHNSVIDKSEFERLMRAYRNGERPIWTNPVTRESFYFEGIDYQNRTYHFIPVTRK